MPVVLRKRKAASPPPPAKRAKAPAVAKAATKAKKAVAGKPAPTPAKKSPPVVGEVITLDGFGGEIETNDGKKTTLKTLLDESKAGVVIFTYPKASTPGCTTQVCLFRDAYEPLTKDGLSIYGLSSDPAKANTSFKEKQKLPYPLLCDGKATLLDAIGLKKAGKDSAVRGIFAIDKTGKVLIAETGGPAATLAAVKKVVEGSGGKSEPKAEAADAAANGAKDEKA